MDLWFASGVGRLTACMFAVVLAGCDGFEIPGGSLLQRDPVLAENAACGQELPAISRHLSEFSAPSHCDPTLLPCP
mgnify:CR=1 FL=1